MTKGADGANFDDVQLILLIRVRAAPTLSSTSCEVVNACPTDGMGVAKTSMIA